MSIVALVLALVFTNMPAYYQLLKMPEAALGILGVALGILVNGILIAIFGNSLGKAIFGIKVFKVGSDRRLPFLTALGREFTVWVYGLGLGIPIVALVTMIVQYRRVGSAKTTGYDAGQFLVRQKPVGAGGITLGVIVAILLMVGVAALGAIGNAAPTQSTLISWTNPDSGLRTTITSDWEASLQTADDGSKSTRLQNISAGEQILVALETSTSLSLQQYTQALTNSLSSHFSFLNWTGANNGQVMASTGTMKSHGWPVDIYVYKVGHHFWRVISFDLTGQASGHFIDQMTHAAIVQTFN